MAVGVIRRVTGAGRNSLAVVFAAMILLAGGGVLAAERFINLASTTSTENSGLFAHLLPQFTARSGIAVRVIAVGTGAALRLGARGDVDVVLVHARAAEDAFMAAGNGALRRDVMYNDFVVVGPRADPAGIRGGRHVGVALSRILRTRNPFASRGDNSGTHMAELSYWRAAGLEPQYGSGTWYLETGAGMGATLNLAAARGAYALVDRATWLAFANRGNLAILLEGDPRLHNPYGVMLVNPARHAHVKRDDGLAFIRWLTGAAGQAAIAAFRIDGEQVFFPGAGKPQGALGISRYRAASRPSRGRSWRGATGSIPPPAPAGGRRRPR
jgi:tungstate transport system substrate-binding protein